MFNREKMNNIAELMRCERNQNNITCCCKTLTCDVCIPEFFISALGALTIDLGFEFGYTAEDTINMAGWVKESLLSSGITSIWLMLLSGISREWYERCKHQNVKNGDRNQCYDTGFNILSQAISGIASFGTGMAVDLALELFFGHASFNNIKLEHSLASVAAPITSTLIKSLVRYGTFKIGPAIIAKFMNHHGDAINDEEMQALLGDDHYTVVSPV